MVIEVVGNNNYLSVAQHAVRTLAIQTGIVVCKGVTLHTKDLETMVDVSFGL